MAHQSLKLQFHLLYPKKQQNVYSCSHSSNFSSDDWPGGRDCLSFSAFSLSVMTSVYRNLLQRTLNLTLSLFFLIFTAEEEQKHKKEINFAVNDHLKVSVKNKTVRRLNNEHHLWFVWSELCPASIIYSAKPPPSFLQAEHRMCNQSKSHHVGMECLGWKVYRRKHQKMQQLHKCQWKTFFFTKRGQNRLCASGEVILVMRSLRNQDLCCATRANLDYKLGHETFFKRKWKRFYILLLFYKLYGRKCFGNSTYLFAFVVFWH